MSYLLLPEDERELVTYLVAEQDLRLLLDDVAPRGRTPAKNANGPREPHASLDPLAALPRELPGPPRHGESVVRSLMFWAPDLGELVGLGDPGRSTDPISRVGLAMTKEHAEGRWADVIDQERSPLIVWRRCFWQEDAHLTPGQLQRMAAPLRMWTQSGGSRYRAIERWLRKDASRIDPFDHCGELPVAVPADRRRFTVWARPAAADWVRAGG